MKFKFFNRIAAECKCKNPMLFDLEHDRILRAEEVECFEQSIQLELPLKLKEFLLEYGGGYFGYANIYSLDSESCFYLLNHNDIPIAGYLRIADNGCGDHYLLCTENQRCLDPVFFYDHETKVVCNTEYADVLEYLVKVGLKVEIGS